MNKLSENIIQIYGDAGRAWLQSLPDLVAQIARTWHLTELKPVDNLSYNYVLKGLQGATPIVVKLGVEHENILREAAALAAYNGQGCVRLFDIDTTHNALLIEQAVPGTSLKNWFPADDEAAVVHAAAVMQQLHAVPLAENPLHQDIATLLWPLETNKVCLPEKHINKAWELAQQLLATQAEPVLLHGDLHYDNILSTHGGNWIAIDPKGVVGEPAYEVGSFVRNPDPGLLQQKDPTAIMVRRLILFSELLEIDQQRLRDWSYVQAVLAACWAMEDGQPDPVMALAEAELLDNL